jgi:hypothetical protein
MIRSGRSNPTYHCLGVVSYRLSTLISGIYEGCSAQGRAGGVRGLGGLHGRQKSAFCFLLLMCPKSGCPIGCRPG